MGAGRAATETVIAFAGEKWAFLVQFSDAEAMVVSMVAVQGRAVVLLVSMSPRCRASCAKKFSLRAHNGPKWAFSGVLSEFFRGRAAGGLCWASFFADRQSWDPTGRTLSRRSPGRRPFYWQC